MTMSQPSARQAIFPIKKALEEIRLRTPHDFGLGHEGNYPHAAVAALVAAVTGKLPSVDSASAQSMTDTPTPPRADQAATDLLPCPFCGEVADYALGYGAACTNPTCGAGVPCRGDDFSPWNRRADLAAPSASEGQPITMTYRNYRGEVADRTVTPKRIWWGSTDWHPEPGWLMTAYDPDKQADRDFALADADFRRVAPSAPAHPDDEAVDRFAAAMKAKLAKKRADGRGGWEDDTCGEETLSRMLIEHVRKGDPLDVGNFAMMLHQRGESIAAPSAPAEVEGLVEPHSEQIQVWADELMSDLAMRDLLTVNDYDDKISALREIREKLTLCAAHRDDALTALQARVTELETERDDAMALFHAADKQLKAARAKLKGEA